MQRRFVRGKKGGFCTPVAALSCILSLDSAAATNFLARTSGLDATHTNALKALLNGLTTDGFFDGSGSPLKLDGLYIFKTSSAANARLNLAQNAFNLTENNSPVFTVNEGYTGTGGTTNAYVDTGFTPGTSSGLYAQNSACLGIWTRTASSGSGGNFSGMLAGDTSVQAGISNGFFDTTTIETNINDVFGAPGITATGTGVGLSIGNRSASNAVQLYHNGSSVGSNSTASAALTSAVSLTFLVKHFGTGTNQSSDEQLAAGLFGGNLSSTDHSNLYSRLNTFMAAF